MPSSGISVNSTLVTRTSSRRYVNSYNICAIGALLSSSRVETIVYDLKGASMAWFLNHYMINVIWVVQSLAKNKPLLPRRETPSCLRRPVPTEGRFAIVTSAGRDAVAAAVSARNLIAGRGPTRERSRARRTNDAGADGQVVWS